MVEVSLCYIMDKFVFSTISYLSNCFLDYPLLTAVLVVIIPAIIFMVYENLSKLSQNAQLNYDYGPERGPHSWEVIGSNQSPININTSLVEISNIRQQLMWNHYNDLPTSVTIENNGHTVILKARYAANVPTLSGADLFQSYSFDSICFHWSFWNTEGSEHTIDSRTYPLEIQASHKNVSSMSCLTNHDTLIIGYLFEISAHNPFLDPIVLNLCRIRNPGTVAEIPPFPLAWLCYQFHSGFFSYGGSKSTPPCEEGVEWFIHSEPMAISESQLMEFRSLLSLDGVSRIIRNSRPVQCLTDNRTVIFNQYEGGGSGSCCSFDSQQQQKQRTSNAQESDEDDQLVGAPHRTVSHRC